MIFLISPAKTLDFEASSLTDKVTKAEFLEKSAQLIERMREFDSPEIMKLMKVSENIAKLNVQRFADWQLPFTLQNAKQALFAFKGDVYSGLSVESMSLGQLDYLQNNLRILSGLYGLLKPMDLIQAYRLEMGIKLANSKGKSLYDFWGEQITDLLNKHLASNDSTLVNLASNEYYKSVRPSLIRSKIITPVFKDEKNGKFKIISFYAKKARGLMVRYAADHLIDDVEELKSFNYDGYRFCEEASTDNEWFFLRNEKT